MQQSASEKYAVGEYERRFLLSAVPPEANNPRRIADRYLDNTRLRLRAVTTNDANGGGNVLKLGHKRRVNDDDPTQIMCTSLYLDEAEFTSLSALPARPLEKTRWAINIDGQPCSVDEFAGDLEGLILLEVDMHDPARLNSFAPPPWAGTEITYDETFTGGQLAGRSFADVENLVRQLLSAD